MFDFTNGKFWSEIELTEQTTNIQTDIAEHSRF